MAQNYNHINIYGTKSLKSAGYCGETMEVKFSNGSAYRYSPCSKEIYTGLINSHTPDKYFNENVRGKIDFVRG